MPPHHIPYLHVVWRSGKEPGVYYVDFSEVLHSRGTDKTFSRNEWDAGSLELGEQDSDLLKTIVRKLFQENSGVAKLQVSVYRINIFASEAFTPEYIFKIVYEACRETGYSVKPWPRRPPSQFERFWKWLAHKIYG